MAGWNNASLSLSLSVCLTLTLSKSKLFTTAAVHAFRHLFAKRAERNRINRIRDSRQPSGNKEAVGDELYPKNGCAVKLLVTSAFHQPPFLPFHPSFLSFLFVPSRANLSGRTGSQTSSNLLVEDLEPSRVFSIRFSAREVITQSLSEGHSNRATSNSSCYSQTIDLYGSCLTSCAGTTCHARPEFLVHKLQYSVGSKYV